MSGRVAFDCGASTGGFTQALLDPGACRVYAVDAGFGQLLGSLRQDPRVVNLERTNLADAVVDERARQEEDAGVRLFRIIVPVGDIAPAAAAARST